MTKAANGVGSYTIVHGGASEKDAIPEHKPARGWALYQVEASPREGGITFDRLVKISEDRRYLENLQRRLERIDKLEPGIHYRVDVAPGGRKRGKAKSSYDPRANPTSAGRR